MTTQPTYVLMPAVATEEMIRAGYGKDPGFGRLSAAIYAALVAARPHPAGELREAVAAIVRGAIQRADSWRSAPFSERVKGLREDGDWAADAILALLNSAVEAPHSKDVGASVVDIGSTAQEPKSDSPAEVGEDR